MTGDGFWFMLVLIIGGFVFFGCFAWWEHRAETRDEGKEASKLRLMKELEKHK